MDRVADLIAPPFEFVEHFNINNITPTQPIANQAAIADSLSAAGKDWEFLDRPRRIRRLDLVANVWDTGVGTDPIPVTVANLEFQMKLGGNVQTINETNGGTLNIQQVQSLQPKLYRPGIVCDTIALVWFYAGLNLFLSWTPTSLRYELGLAAHFYKEDEYQQYLKDLESAKRSGERWG